MIAIPRQNIDYEIDDLVEIVTDPGDEHMLLSVFIARERQNGRIPLGTVAEPPPFMRQLMKQSNDADTFNQSMVIILAGTETYTYVLKEWVKKA